MRAILGIFLTAITMTQAAAAGGTSKPQFVLMRNPASPFVSFRIWIKTGSASDPSGKEGLAFLTGSLIGQGGTLTNSYETILRKLFPMAASYSVQVDREMTVLTGRVHKDYLQSYYALLRDALLTPAFREDDFTRLKTNQANYLATTLRYSSDEELGKAVLHSVAFAGTSYAHPEQGLVQSVKALTLDDVKNFYKKFYTSSNLVIGIAGGFGDDLVERVRTDLQLLPAGTPVVSPLPPIEPKKQGLHVYIIDKDTRATAISFGHPIAITRASDDFYPLLVANSWLGEHRNSSSHLFQVMREARGLNYGDYSYIEWFPQGGASAFPRPNVGRQRQMFEVWIRPVVNDNRHFALRQAIRELTMLVANGMTREASELTRNFLLSYTLNYAPTQDYRLGYKLDDVFYGLQQSHLDRLQQHIKAVTPEQSSKALKSVIHPEDMDIVIVTNEGEELKKALIGNASSPIHYDSPTPEAILAEDKIIQDYKLAISAENVHVIPAQEVFEK